MFKKLDLERYFSVVIEITAEEVTNVNKQLKKCKLENIQKFIL